MAQAKSKRTHARASAAAAGAKRARRARNAGATGHGSKQQRSGGATMSTRKKERSGAPAAPDEPTPPRRTPSEYDPDSGSVEPGGRQSRGGRADEIIDEETDARSKRPGGTGDASFGDDDEGPEGPAR